MNTDKVNILDKHINIYILKKNSKINTSKSVLRSVSSQLISYLG